MDFASKSKKQLKALAEALEVEVMAKKKNKPTLDELVVALEAFEQDNPGFAEETFKDLGFTDEVEDDEEDEGDDLPETKAKGHVYTYVGKGETSPQRINFMGRQEFVRGRPVEVTDPLVLRKIQGVPTFVKGKVDPELLQDIEDEGIAVAEKNRKMDAQMDANFKKQHGGAAKEG